MPQFGNLPEVVKYTEFGKEHLAFPIASRDMEHHLGDNSEPLLSLVFVKQPALNECARCHFPEHAHGKPVAPEAKAVPCDTFVPPPRSTVLQPSDFVQIVHDVAHESHGFTDEQIQERRKAGLSDYPGNQIPGGRWRELSSAEISSGLVIAKQRESYLKAKAEEAEAAAKKKAAEEVEQAKNVPAPVDDITREALIRNKQEELKAATPAPAKPAEPVVPTPSDDDSGTGSIN